MYSQLSLCTRRQVKLAEVGSADAGTDKLAMSLV